MKIAFEDFSKFQKVLLERTEDNQATVNLKEYLDEIIDCSGNRWKKYYSIKKILGCCVLDFVQYHRWIDYVTERLDI